MKSLYTLGIDIGSTACKAVALKDGREIFAKSVVQIGTGTSGPQRVYDGLFASSGLSPDDIAYTVVTGYGRMTFDKADKQISELSCHARGVNFLMPEARTVIDIGGQDAKALKLSPKGKMLGFVMNDKCAAGTGRFLDVMANVLELSVSQLASLGERSAESVQISNICTVFAESEVISHLAAGKKREDIIAGIHLSVANRVAGLARRIGIEPEIIMTGGVAQNGGVVKAMSEVLELPIKTSPIPQFTGALGAALHAFDEVNKGKEQSS